MSFGAGTVAAKKYGAKKIIDPRPYTRGTIRRAYERFPQIGPLIPALGYSSRQIKELQRSINNTPADSIIMATPIDLRRFIKLNKPVVKIDYRLEEKNKAKFESIIMRTVRSR
jgi:predicted GTPase